MYSQSTSVNSEIQEMIEMGLITKKQKKSSKFFANIKKYLSLRKKKNYMKTIDNIMEKISIPIVLVCCVYLIARFIAIVVFSV